VTVGDPQVSGTTATVTFSSVAADLDHLECSLDGGAFAECTSPKTFGGLAAGSHTVSVHGIDALGNVGADAAKAFTVAGAQSSGGGGQTTGGSGTTTATEQSSGGSSTVAAVDKTKPKVTLVAKSLKASNKGTVSFTVGCPATETSCTIKLQLKSGKQSIASKTVTVKGGKTRTVTLTLNAATKKLLKKHSSLKVSTVLTATDAAGNKRITTKQATLRRAAA
jgi:hypothetical protein